MSKIFKLLEELSQLNLISGAECTSTQKQAPSLFAKYRAKIDDFGNLYIEKKSKKPNAKNILIEAHLDTIGLCVKEIVQGGFLSVCNCGGFDNAILPGTEFLVYGKKPLKAIATSIPPHLQKNDGEKNGKVSLSDIYLDCGFFSKEEAEQYVDVGTPVSFAAKSKKMLGSFISAPSLDNKAAVISLLLAASDVKSDHNVTFLFSMGEETTSRGVKNASFFGKPDVALIVDAGFGFTKGLNPDQCIFTEQGPSVSIADTLNREATSWVMNVAKQKEIPLQVVVEPGGTGTSATALQLRNGGIPCALISIPLKYMHTPSEMVSEQDIIQTSKLICALLSENEIPFGEVNFIESI